MELLNRVWLGDAGLGKTYWLFGQVAGALLFVPLVLVVPGSTSAVFLSALYAGYLLWVCTGIWRAASKYTGPNVWAWFAKVFSLFGYMAAAALLIGVFVAATSPQQEVSPYPGLKPFTGKLDGE